MHWSRCHIAVKEEQVEGETCFIGTVQEYPNVEAYGKTYQEAHDLIKDAVITLNE